MSALPSSPPTQDPAASSADTPVEQLTAERLAATSGAAKDRAGVPAPHPAVDLPPGPRLPPLAQTVGMLRFRHSFVPAMRRRFGDTFTVRLLPGGQPTVLFSRAEHAKQIFAGDPEVFHAGKGNAILGPIMGQHSLLLQDSTDHKRARKLLMPAFNGQAMRGYRDLVREVARAEVATWRAGEKFRSLDRMNRLTLEVILRVVFGVTDEERLARLRPRVNRTVNISPAVVLGWSEPRLQKLPPWSGTLKNAKELDRLIHAEIRERREVGDLEERSDVLSTLMRVGTADAEGEQPLGDVELRDQLVTLLLAGHETTATALAWALYELGRHPALLARAHAAADEDDEAFLEAVLKEAMRLHPVIPMVVRTLMRPATIGGREYPTGTTVAPSILLAHASAENHDEPEEFRPERFLGQNPPPNTWIPFGGGVRRCIGAGFSLMEGVVVLREVLSDYDVASVGQDHPRVRNITSVPRHGARVRVLPR